MNPPQQNERNLPEADKLQEYLKKTMIDGSFRALLLFNVDGFRKYNLRYGLEAGDQLLGLIEEYLQGCGRVGYRTAGDDYGLVVEPSEEAFDDQEFRAGLARFITEHGGEEFTVSGGGVWHPGEDFNLDPRLDTVVLNTARQLLARAKEQGRNRVLWLPRSGAATPELLDLVVGFYEELARANSSLVRELKVESRIDFLTGLANRRGFEDVASRMTEAAQRSGAPLALIYLDSDSLKRINDTRGHDAGDRFLTDISRVLRQVVRGSDFISRWGADEFAVLMDAATPEKALALANRILHAVATRTEGTVSIGVYCGVPVTPEEAVQQADRALYRAKELGKNRVEASQP
jgi:diguanylate cyclase (GGDEF)-like protein